MKRDNRANVWFLAIFLALTLPGVVILVRRRMRSEAPPLMFPDAASHRLIYMTPPPAPPDASWTVPPLTRTWVDHLVHERYGATQAVFGTDPRGDPVPLISDDYAVQVVWLDLSSGAPRAALLLWREVPDPVPSRFSVSTHEIGQPALERSAGGVISASPLLVPQEVRQEMMAGGYLRPPRQIIWLDVSLPGNGPFAQKVAMSVTYPALNSATVTSVNLFTK